MWRHVVGLSDVLWKRSPEDAKRHEVTMCSFNHFWANEKCLVHLFWVIGTPTRHQVLLIRFFWCLGLDRFVCTSRLKNSSLKKAAKTGEQLRRIVSAWFSIARKFGHVFLCLRYNTLTTVGARIMPTRCAIMFRKSNPFVERTHRTRCER